MSISGKTICILCKHVYAPVSSPSACSSTDPKAQLRKALEGLERILVFSLLSGLCLAIFFAPNLPYYIIGGIFTFMITGLQASSVHQVLSMQNQSSKKEILIICLGFLSFIIPLIVSAKVYFNCKTQLNEES